jgi:hypothetical protein
MEGTGDFWDFVLWVGLPTLIGSVVLVWLFWKWSGPK